MARVVEYTPEHFERLQEATRRMGRAFSLRHRPFVDYYYATREWSKLYLFLGGDDRIQGTIGVDRMRFEWDSREITLGCGSNFHASGPTAGGYLFMRWMTSCEVGIVFGGSPDTHRILRAQRWTYVAGARMYYLNLPYIRQSDEAWWVAALKWGLRYAAGASSVDRFAARIGEVAAELTVREEHAYAEDLLPRQSPFAFRFAPDLAYLSWRYALGLSFVRYRLFRILSRGSSVGYVIINEAPERLIVAQCDADDAVTLAYGVLLSLCALTTDDATPRGVVLTCCPPEMGRIFKTFGFRARWADRPFAVGGLRGHPVVPADTSKWLINYDWGDNGLRAPFRDQSAREAA